MGPAAAMTPCRIIAHRAGNDLTALRAVAGLADVAEADVHLFRGRLEVRHAKTIGPVPVLWERWLLVPRPPRALGLAEVLAAVPDGTGLMLDLKGPDPRLPRAVRAAIAGWADGRALVVSSRVWPHLATFRGRPGLVTMRSAGTRWRRTGSWATGGCSRRPSLPRSARAPTGCGRGRWTTPPTPACSSGGGSRG